MKKYNIGEKLYLALAALLMLSVAGIPAQVLAQQEKDMQQTRQEEVHSDFEIQKNFKESYASIRNNLQEADSSAYVDKLVQKVKKLEADYRKHEELLNKVFYPTTFDQKIQELKKNVLSTHHYLATIERQDKELIKLTKTVDSYNSRIETLNNRTDSLLAVIDQSSKNEEELNSLVRRYKQDLKKRDNLILSFVDSVMIAYEELDYSSIKDFEEVGKRSRFNANGNALSMIRNIVNDNLELLENNPKLSTGEYLRINAVQQKVENLWGKLGDDIVNIYGEDQQDKKELNQKIARWDKQINVKTWESVNTAFDSAGVALPKFTSSEGFYTTMMSYIDESLKNSKEKNTEDNYQNYREFSNFWKDPVKQDWSNYFIKGDVMTSRQIATIDSRLEKWEKAAEPESNLLVYLLGFSVLAIVALGIILAKEKTSDS